jgi:phospho-N-acetylmuramoyl-pentapeptide-transferase
LIVAATVLALLATTDHRSPFLPGLLVAVVGMAGVGAIDDAVKLRSGRRGLRPRHKLALQFPVALTAALLVHHAHVEPGVWFVPLAALVLVASANAVNLTDGLDGLAGGCFVVAAAALAVAGAWTATAGSGEAKVLLSAACGSVLAFLWFNCHPAAVFMGNCGSLALGGILGAAAIVARQELLLAIVGGVFVAETLSVIVQIVSLRWRQRRVLRCAPLHHHFQLAGWPESKIVVRFWIAGVACAALGLVAEFAVRTPSAAKQALTPAFSQRERASERVPLLACPALLRPVDSSLPDALTPALSRGERETTMAARATLARQGRP